MAHLPEFVKEWLSIETVAERLGVSKGRVRRLVQDQYLLAVSSGGEQSIPADFIVDDEVLSSLRGTLIVLADAGYSTDEALTWLYTEDEEIGSTPIAALLAGRKATVRRVAQTLGF